MVIRHLEFDEAVPLRRLLGGPLGLRRACRGPGGLRAKHVIIIVNHIIIIIISIFLVLFLLYELLL